MHQFDGFPVMGNPQIICHRNWWQIIYYYFVGVTVSVGTIPPGGVGVNGDGGVGEKPGVMVGCLIAIMFTRTVIT